MRFDPWRILGIAPTVDAKAVREAYARMLKTIDQATRSESFFELRQAYEAALVHCKSNVVPIQLVDTSISQSQPAEENQNELTRSNASETQPPTEKPIARLISGAIEYKKSDRSTGAQIHRRVQRLFLMQESGEKSETLLHLRKLVQKPLLLGIESRLQFERQLVNRLLETRPLPKELALAARDVLRWDDQPLDRMHAHPGFSCLLREIQRLPTPPAPKAKWNYWLLLIPFGAIAVFWILPLTIARLYENRNVPTVMEVRKDTLICSDYMLVDKYEELLFVEGKIQENVLRQLLQNAASVVPGPCLWLKRGSLVLSAVPHMFRVMLGLQSNYRTDANFSVKFKELRLRRNGCWPMTSSRAVHWRSCNH